MNCPYCNSQIPSNSRFCESCGAKLDFIDNTNTTTPPQQVNTATANMTTEASALALSQANTSLKLGITSAILAFIPVVNFVSFILGPIGMKKASNARKFGFRGPKQKTAFYINLGSVLLAFIMIYATLGGCSSRSKRDRDENAYTPSVTTTITATEATTTTEETKEDLSSLEGTYVGSNGSVIVIHDNKFADYYYDGYGVSTSNAWKIENGKFYMTVNVLLFTETYADLPSGDVSVLNLKSDSIFWDDEVFTKVNNDTATPSEETCKSLVKEFKK